MALTYGFYSSLNGDRKYSALQWSSIFDSVITDGVLGSYGDLFAVTASNPADMTLTVGSGRAWFDHSWILNDGDPNDPITLTWDAAHELAPEPLLPRIDAIAIQTDHSSDVRASSIVVIKGTPASTPTRPTPTNTVYVGQHIIAYVRIEASATGIEQAKITNNVGTTTCPLSTSVLQQTDISRWLAQWEADYADWKNGNDTDFTAWRTAEETAFSEWFQNLQDWLTPQEAATLANQILMIKRELTAEFQANAWVTNADGTFTQQVSCTGMTANDNPMMFKEIDNTRTVDQQKAYNKAYACLTDALDAVTGANTVTLTVLKKPEIDIIVGFKGV